MENQEQVISNFFVNMYDLNNEMKKIFKSSFDKNIITKNIKLIKDNRFAIIDEIWNINKKENNNFLLSILDLIEKYTPEYNNDVKKLNTLFDSQDSRSKELILFILKNDIKNLAKFASENKLTNEFLTFFSIFSAYPYRNAVTKFIEKKYDLNTHVSGFCPVCGHWPGMSYIVGEKGIRHMACICCGAHWTFKRLQCSFCLTNKKGTMEYLHVEDEDWISAYTCDDCRRYIKTVRVESEKIDFKKEIPMIDYLNSSFIDIAAIQNKYVQDSILGIKFSSPYDKNIEKYT